MLPTPLDFTHLLAAIGQKKKLVFFRKHQIIFSQGNRGESIFYIEKGSARLTLASHGNSSNGYAGTKNRLRVNETDSAQRCRVCLCVHHAFDQTKPAVAARFGQQSTGLRSRASSGAFVLAAMARSGRNLDSAQPDPARLGQHGRREPATGAFVDEAAQESSASS